jgi:CubicO group peptidase (beta-lactamase class C family)
MSFRTALAVTTAASIFAVGCSDASLEDASAVSPADQGVAPQGLYDIVLPNTVPHQGSVNVNLAHVDAAVEKFMRATCTGGIVLGATYGNQTIINRGYGYKKGPPTPNCASTGDPFVGGTLIGPNTPFRLGSNSKAITAAILRIVLKQHLASLGRPTTDAEVESLRIFDDQLDLVSPAFRAASRQNVWPSPIAPSMCRPSGQTFNYSTDPRWKDITVGHLLGHRSGLPRGGNGVESKLSLIRHIDTASEMHQESWLTGAPTSARSALAAAVPGADFLRAPSLEEYLIGNLDLCFQFTPGTEPPAGVDPYSNFGYGILQHIAEHVSGRSLHAPLATPEGHDQSLLYQFTDTRLGFTHGATSQFGIYMSQPVEGKRDLAEPVYRAWDGSSINGQFWDTKRPYCVWNTDFQRCDASPFFQQLAPFDYGWAIERVGVGYDNQGFSGGVGLLAAEMPLYLKFMNRYWVSGAGSTPYYGRERASNPSSTTRWHIGALLGTHSTVAQFAGDYIKYAVVPEKANGELDLTNFDGTGPSSGCKLPAGLNIALATNQVNDATCGTDICDDRYMAPRDVVKQALCATDWQKVSPVIGISL